jgi:hypothetical protein
MSLKSNIFNALVDTEKTELYGIMGTGTSHEFYPIRYVSSLIVLHMDEKEEIEQVSDDPRLVQLIELYARICAEFMQSDPAIEKSILSLTKNL